MITGLPQKDDSQYNNATEWNRCTKYYNENGLGTYLKQVSPQETSIKLARKVIKAENK